MCALFTDGLFTICVAVSLLLGVPPVPAAQVQVSIVWCVPLAPAFLLGYWA